MSINATLFVQAIVFAILVVINFIVVTKGAERIAEVGARFTLDAMPGKQMAIDADLNAGLIGEEEARERRAKIAEEANFFGSMDGASKFVRGDAMAGILIMVINIVGGLIIGILQTRNLHDALIGISREFGRPIATAKQAREISKIGVFYDSVEESLQANGFAPNRNGGHQGFLRKVA